MPVGFGFSVGDFISGVLFVKDLIHALDNVSGSSSEYQALCGELRALERALGLVCNLTSDVYGPAHRQAIEQSVQACHGIIQAFLARAAKFNVTLTCPPRAPQQGVAAVSAWKVALRKVQWALLKKDDVVRVRLELSAQTTILNTLLNHTQVQVHKNHEDVLAQLNIQMSLQQDRLREIDARLLQQSRLVEDTRGELSTYNQRLGGLQREISSSKTTILLVWRLGKVLFEMIKGVQKYLVNPMPAQILLQKVFHSSLEARFRNHPGWTSVKRMDYLIFDQRTDQLIDLSKPWDAILRPDRKLAMCIVLPRHAWSTPSGTCPRCGFRTKTDPAAAQKPKDARHSHGQGVRHYKCTCGLYFSQMRFRASPAGRHGSKYFIGRSGISKQRPSMSTAQDNMNSQKQNDRRVKLKRIKNVERDLWDLQRVFVFEQASVEAETLGRRRGSSSYIEVIQSTQALEDDHGSKSNDERRGPMYEVETPPMGDPKPDLEAIDTGAQSLSTRFDENGLQFEADEQWEIESMSSCFTFVTNLSSLNAICENGRRYHGFHNGIYFQPDDEQAQKNLDVGHHLCTRLLGGELYLAPVGDRPQKVLDVGTGTGIWAIEFADKFPECCVEGCDLSPIQPEWVPPNLTFYIDDASSLDPSCQNYDLIHVRGLNGCFQDWDGFYKSAFRALRPGGWIEQVELSLNLFDQENLLSDDDPVLKLQKILSEASRITGRPLDVYGNLHAGLGRNGFSQVFSRKIKCPIGPWAKGKFHKECGIWALHYWSGVLEDLCLALLTRFLGWSVKDVNVVLGEVRSQLWDKKGHLCFRVFVAYGRKPL